MSKAKKNKIQEVSTAPISHLSVSDNHSITSFSEIQWLLILLGALAFISFYIYGDFLFGKKLFLFKDIGSDSMNGLYPYIYQNAAYFEEYGNWSWSFKNGMGQSLFPFVFRDPFDFIMFFTSKDSIVYWLGWKEVMKIFSAGLLFYYFLKRTTVIFAAMTTYLIPITSIFWGYVDHEAIGWLHLLSLATILSGVALVGRKK
jgi:drug/metabolite transporter (DMT)-like permease